MILPEEYREKLKRYKAWLSALLIDRDGWEKRIDVIHESGLEWHYSDPTLRSYLAWALLDSEQKFSKINTDLGVVIYHTGEISGEQVLDAVQDHIDAVKKEKKANKIRQQNRRYQKAKPLTQEQDAQITAEIQAAQVKYNLTYD